METWLTITVAVGSVLVSGGAIVTFWMNFATRIANNKSAAEAASTAANNANIAVASAHLEIDRLKDELVDHRVAVAREYVSKETLASLENRIVDAINRLGDRFDKMLAPRG